MDETSFDRCRETAEAEINLAYLPEYRASFIQAHGPHCVYCAKRLQLSPRATRAGRASEAVVDHIVPAIKGGTNVPSNLTVACNECNCSKAGRDLADFLARKGALS